MGKRKGRGGNKSGFNGRDNRCSFLIKFCTPIFWLGFVTFVILFLLPALFVFIGDLLPDLVASEVAIERFYSNISYGVGIVSLIVGVISIFYSYMSNKNLDAQARAHENFMVELRNKMDDVIRILWRIRESSISFPHSEGDMTGTSLSDSSVAKEKAPV